MVKNSKAASRIGAETFSSYRSKSYLHYLCKLVFSYRKTFALIVFLFILETATRIVQPYFMKIVVDMLTEGVGRNFFSPQQVQFLILIVVSWFFAAILNNIFNASSMHAVWRIGYRCYRSMHRDGYRRLLQLDYYQHTKKHSSQYVKIVEDGEEAIYAMVNWWLGRFLSSSLTFVVMVVLAFSVSWQMTLVSIAVIPVGLSIIIFMIRRYNEKQHRVNKQWTRLSEHFTDQIGNIISYKLNQNERLFVKKQDLFFDEAMEPQKELNKKWRLVEMLNPDALARFLVMGMGIFFVKDGSITLGSLFMFMGLLNEILIPLHLLGDILPHYNRRARHIDRFLNLMAQQDTVVDPAKPVRLKRVKGRIEFRDVSYAYGTQKKEEPLQAEKTGSVSLTIRNLSFTIEPGQHVALVGHSGAGKSTIMALLTRLVDPVSGQIFLDGTDIRKFAQAEYRSYIGTVLQEHALYNETIAENIAYGKPGATRTGIVKAAKMAAAHDFIQKLTQGYDMLVGERGVRLSGGEKQRLAIARAILKHPAIVVLDEPTSALDSITEARVQKGLQALIEGRTALVIAHRLSTVRNADRILILKNGELFASGSHAELLRHCEEYRQMVELQTGGFLADE